MLFRASCCCRENDFLCVKFMKKLEKVGGFESFGDFLLTSGQNFIRVYASECVVVSVRLCTIILQLGSG